MVLTIYEGTLAQVFSFKICKIFKNTFFYRTPLVAAFLLKENCGAKDYCLLIVVSVLSKICEKIIKYIIAV